MLADTPASLTDLHAMGLLAAFVFGSVFLVVLIALQVAQARQAVRRRAVAFNPASGPSTVWDLEVGAGKRRRPRRSREGEDASELLFAVEKGMSAGGDARLSKLRKELVRAGYFGPNAVLWYYAARLGVAVAFALISLKLRNFGLPEATPAATLTLVLAGAALGLVVPAIFVRRRQAAMLQQCRAGFPSFLDLLAVCSEAGLTPRAGIERISREMTRTHPYLGANLFLMSLELQAGRPLVEAVEALGRRLRLDDVRSLGTLLQQTEELGSNLTTALRVFSEEMRARRMLRAEEKAHALPVKLVLPLAVFVFPVMLVVALLPVFVRIQKAFF